MARAHAQVMQAGEIVFCDSTASLDRFNTSFFLLSTMHACSGIPLAAVMVSDETDKTVSQAMEIVKQVIPSANAFHGKGPSAGPSIFMLDDSIVEQAALAKSWPSATLLLCTFHFLQRQWTWLYDGKNKIQKDDRIALIQKIKGLVYSNTKEDLQSKYTSLISSETALRYPHFITHMSEVWQKRKLWAHCSRKSLLIRGNHTNNYAEAGIKILKDLIFGRVKAYNLVQMFYFVVETLELYYKRKFLNIANNRLSRTLLSDFRVLMQRRFAKLTFKELVKATGTKFRANQREGCTMM